MSDNGHSGTDGALHPGAVPRHSAFSREDVMPAVEIEFELPAVQYELMEYAGLRQGQPLSLVLDAGVLSPDPAAEGWFAVQKEPLAGRFQQVGPALYAFAGQIQEADIGHAGDAEMAALVVQCGRVPLRVICAPGEDGRLPFGTWETRHLCGVGRIQGIVEEGPDATVGRPVGVTIWHFRRLILGPGDPFFGQWHESVELVPAPYRYDRVLVTARLHRESM
jgi:hypothetical protein